MLVPQLATRGLIALSSGASRSGVICASLIHTKTTALVQAACTTASNCFDVPANAFDGGHSVAGSADVGIGLIFLAVIFFLAGLVTAGDEDPNNSATAHPSAISKPGTSDERASKQVFGWLHVRDVYALPTYEALQSACHKVGNGVGEHEGYEMYLCAAANKPDAGLGCCELSAAFTTHYGAEVHLCRGGRIGGAD